MHGVIVIILARFKRETMLPVLQDSRFLFVYI
jgi:hypothetical protein